MKHTWTGLKAHSHSDKYHVYTILYHFYGRSSLSPNYTYYIKLCMLYATNVQLNRPIFHCTVLHQSNAAQCSAVVVELDQKCSEDPSALRCAASLDSSLLGFLCQCLIFPSFDAFLLSLFLRPSLLNKLLLFLASFINPVFKARSKSPTPDSYTRWWIEGGESNISEKMTAFVNISRLMTNSETLVASLSVSDQCPHSLFALYRQAVYFWLYYCLLLFTPYFLLCYRISINFIY